MAGKNKRLQLLVDLITPGSVIADIGTDHAYLPIASVLQQKASFAYAADINQKPLDQAIKNINQRGLTDKIKPVLSDGLTYFNDEEIRLDYVIISGLGSATIVKILQQDTKLIKNYLICSNTDPLMIRKLVKKNHWRIKSELFFWDNNRKYWLMSISKAEGLKIKTRVDLFIGPDQNQWKNPMYLEYLQKLYVQNQEILKVSQDRVKNRELKRWNKQILKVI